MSDSDKKSFIMYLDNIDIFSELTDEEAGKLIKAIFEYENTGAISELDRLLKVAFLSIKKGLDANREKYARVCERRKQAGKQGGRPKKTVETEEKPNAFLKKQKKHLVLTKSKKSIWFFKKAKKPDTDTVTDTVNDTDTVTDTELYNMNNINNISPPISPQRGKKESDKKQQQEQDQRFETFWKAYPKKKAKQTAYKAWLKLKPDTELTKTILLALEQHKKSAEWQRDNGQYIPYPATWLNGRRWEDDVSAPVCSQNDSNEHSYNLDLLVEHAMNNTPKIKEGTKNG